ncbi:CCA tRNA nucleotidyltransferase [Candidatus Cardinium hertigii]|uniref:HD domain-containing protein n=1 Tax=Candidatus Cardinium hertigii TaxID=247481 RepID=A0A3N2QB23_9BACT|nr:HD domain-containing protein [Candidatus Cardinium hertigii]ROT46960.1 HD domain-containing protein [Candidatus Cardinium hertigii]ROT47827.1 HD domain-containing protein [Candidatus Cardinium hertigii]ROT47832.1 HD domain-containing protein [Candidatus Cardinium hertigii]
MEHIKNNYPVIQIDKIDHSKILRNIGAVSDALQLETYVVGGFVRDLFLKRTCKDIDIVCVGDGMLLAQAVATHLDKGLSVTLFKNFGTAMLQWNGWIIEFVGTRKESYASSSRNPTVSNGTLADDQMRRDFTINTMAICLNKEHYGLLLDPFNGQHDLADALIRTPCAPEQTFSDDPLRIIRAIRFATQLNFRIAVETWTALTTVRNRLTIVSQERIAEELHKIIAANKPSYGFQLLFETKILAIILPELEKLSGKEQCGVHTHKDNLLHTFEVLDNVAQNSSKLWLRWAAVFHDIAKPLTKKFDPIHGFSFHGHEDLGAKMLPRIFRRLRFPISKEVLGYVQKLVRLHLRPIALAKAVTDTAIRRLLYEAQGDLEDLFLLCRADITSKNTARVEQYLANFDKVEKKVLDVEARDKIRNFQPVITGQVIMQAFALKPSPAVGSIKEAIKEAILEGKIKNEYKEAFQYMLSIGKDYLS